MSGKRTGWGLLSRRDPLSSKASDIYGGLVAQARAVPFYAVLGVPDTPEGRMEVIMMHVVLAARRLQRDGEGQGLLARAVLEAFVTDVDDCMREMGVGDLMVAKKVKKAGGALFDRVRDYGSKLAASDQPGLAVLIDRHVLMDIEGNAAASPNALRIAGYAIEAEARLGGLPAQALMSGAAAFPAVPA
jgi:cytochrome b pre-mRNA-processing protein 3